MEKKIAFGVSFSNAQGVVDFINARRLDKEDIVYLNKQDNQYILIYYGRE